MSLLLISVLIWLGLGPAIFALIGVVYLCTRSKSDHSVASIDGAQFAATDPTELDREVA